MTRLQWKSKNMGWQKDNQETFLSKLLTWNQILAINMIQKVNLEVTIDLRNHQILTIKHKTLIKTATSNYNNNRAKDQSCKRK